VPERPKSTEGTGGTTASPIIEFRGVTKSFGSGAAAVPAVDDLDLTIGRGEIFGIIGYSGAGKSTLVRLINALEHPTSGSVIVEGRDLTTLKEKELRGVRAGIGMIFQQFNLFRSRTVFGNVAYPLKVAGWPKEKRKQRVAELLAFVGLTDKANDLAKNLPYGDQRRLEIARAMATNPELLLLDEPAAGLDPEARTQLSDTFRRLRDEGHTLLVSSHILAELEDYSTHMLIVEDGRVISHTALGDAGTAERQHIRLRFSQPVAAELLTSLTPDILIEDPLTAVAEVPAGDASRMALIRAALDRDLPLLGFAPEKKSLSRFYLDNVAADREARRKGARQEGAQP